MKTFLRTFCLFSVSLSATLLGRSDAHHYEITKPPPAPWFTGPLLAPSPVIVTGGHYNVEPYVFFTTTTGVYDKEWKSHSVPDFRQLIVLSLVQIGLTPWVDFQFVPQAVFQETQGKSSTRFSDLSSTGFQFQVLNDLPYTVWYPAISIYTLVNLPTGKFDRLDPKKLKTDASGSGSYTVTGALEFGKMFHLGGANFLAFRLYGAYNYFPRVYVKGFNTYGGGFGTRGWVYPGNSFQGYFSFEFSMTQRWVFAFDFDYFYSNKNRFNGKNGHLAGGLPATVKSPSTTQISIAPALEYNWSPSLGLIGGVWWTLAGRNSARFISGVVAFNWYI